MQGDGQRLRHRGFARRQAGGIDALRRIGDQTFAECPLNMRKGHGAAVKAHVEAVVWQAFRTRAAGAAGSAGRDGDKLALGKAGGAGAQCLDKGADLVAQDHRFAQAHRAKAAVVIVMQVRAADAAPGQPETKLAGAEWLVRAVFEAQVVGGMNDDRAHVRAPARYGRGGTALPFSGAGTA